MANFKMHLGVAAIGSGMVATLCLGAGLASVQEVAILSLLGTIGGLLPDIDLDHSTPTRLMFTALGLLLAFLAMFFKAAHYSVLELWLVWGATYLAVRYLAWRMFSDLTSHRGIFHSLAAALFFCFLGTAIAYHQFDAPRLTAWLVGFFLLLGYIIHLALDEIYSVDFENRRLKRSFGTALKLIDSRHLNNSGMMLGFVLLLFFMTPDFSPVTDALSNANTWQQLGSHLLPQGTWFAL
ncbi:metal-dependent hydrolase [Candidatus Venteria ishoeyi]|uniref:Inner membrane protein n=1 Tax=Candidatus Venteria ishoeyi TaxID=1899563 RepID=A0A1H6FJC4_9GAMM|nr:metal-dependent hydrolase [Candidatus Venteria ishoeyi]MDM8546765.1 metal-dependent hydrolase [Candidatus Venteria ishoeyi]SEH09135.1 Uncharacterised protein [Candidatus Venteria ishoeyi]SEH09264.1 Uncharacterised protein [Candidatus Venteria ishoeyi]